jgi:branched-chain amino acid transport system substrate-binding protein
MRNRRDALKGIAGVLAMSKAPAAWTQQRVLVGQSTNLTGIHAAFGRATMLGAQSWLKQYNRGATSPVELVTLDDANDPERAAANTRQLLERGAGALFGYASATLSLPALPLVRDAGVPFFAPFTGAGVIHDKFDPLVFTARASFAKEAGRFAQMIASFGASRMGVVYTDSPEGNDTRDMVAAELQKANIAAAPLVAVEADKLSTDEQARRLVQERSDGILFTTLAAPTARLIAKAREFGLPRITYLLALSAVGPSQLAQLLGKDNRGVIVSHVVPPPWATLEVVREHAAAMRTIDPAETPSFASLESYAAMRALTAGLDRMRNARSGLVGALENTNMDLGGYKLRYTRDSRSGSSFVDYTVLGGERVSG